MSGSRTPENADAAERRERLVEVYREASGCTLCPLSESRNTVVFGAGNADADLMFIGEAPGAEEDRRGLPFVGRAGGLLDKLLAEIGLSREQVFIANTLKCRPPGNRDPRPEEIETCNPYLQRQVELIEPKVIATLGNFATKLITRNQTGITRVRGKPQVHELGERTVRVFPILHPAAILRNPSMMETMQGDFAALAALLEKPHPQQRPPEASEPPEPTGPPVSPGAPPAAVPKEDQLDIFGA